MKNLQNSISSNWKSGLTVGLVSIPIAISLAVACKTNPMAGIITALWAGLIAAIFGGSNYNIIGPTGTLTGLLLVNSNLHGPECLPMLAILSGIFIFICYLCKFEYYLIFIPSSALHGFVLGAALVVIFSQINIALGLKHLPQHQNVFINLYTTMLHLSNTHISTFILFSLALLSLLFFAWFTPRFSGTILLTPCGIIIGYLSSIGVLPWHIQTLNVNPINLESALFAFPQLNFNVNYLSAALSIAVISILGSMVSARFADNITKTKHNKRKELLGLSVANIISGLAGGIPATAALARTALNIRSGCTNNTSAIISSLCVAFISLLFLQYFHYLPLAIIAAILVFIALRMIEMEHFVRLFQVDKKNFILSLMVAFVTIYEDATIGLVLGVVIAMLLFMEKLSAGHHKIIVEGKEHGTTDDQHIIQNSSTLVYTIKGPLVYINIQSHIARFEKLPLHYTSVILNLHDVDFIDLDGVEALGEIIQILSKKHIRILFVGLNPFFESLLQYNKDFKKFREKHAAYVSIHDAFIALAQKPDHQDVR